MEVVRAFIGRHQPWRKVITHEQKIAEVHKLLNKIDYCVDSKIPQEFNHELLQLKDRISNDALIIRLIIQRVQYSHSQLQTTKLFYIINEFLVLCQYSQQVMEELESLDLTRCQIEDDKVWIGSFLKNYSKYLMKLPMCSNILEKAIKHNTMIFEDSQQITTIIYRVINQLAILFPTLNNTVNTLGRYYRTTEKALLQLIQQIGLQMTRIYYYLKFLIQYILRSYKNIKFNELLSFMNSINDVHKCCDNVEEFLLSRHLSIPKIDRKIGFREQYIEQVSLYIKCRMLRNVPKFKDQITEILCSSDGLLLDENENNLYYNLMI